MSIPKIIHYCWFGGNPLPEKDRRCIESWKKFCPDYKIIEWNESNYDIHKNKYMEQAYEAKKWGFVPDYARLDIIYKYGGIYLDTDVELLKGLDDLLEQKGFMGFESENAVAPGLIIASVPKNQTIKNMLDSIYANRSFLREDGTYSLVASPKMATDFLVEHGLVCNNRLQEVSGLTIYPTNYFCPKDYVTGKIHITKNTYSIHHYNASWQTSRQRSWHKLEQNLNVYLGDSNMKRTRSCFGWKVAQVIYTKGLLYCLQRLKQKFYIKYYTKKSSGVAAFCATEKAYGNGKVMKKMIRFLLKKMGGVDNTSSIYNYFLSGKCLLPINKEVAA